MTLGIFDSIDDPLSFYGASPQAPTNGGAAPASARMSVGSDDMGGLREMLNPHNPLFWLGAIAAVAVGFAGIAGSARVGPVKVAGAVGSA